MRYTVLTYIFNHYENLKEILEKDPEAEYICVTDDPDLTSDTWNVVYDERLLEISPFNKTFFVRYHPFEYANSDIVVKIDGSIEVKKSLKDIIDAFEDKEEQYDIGLMVHPERDDIIDEYVVWIKTRKYPIENAQRALVMMESLGYDFKTKGLYQLCFSIERRDWLCTTLDDIVYSFLEYLSDGKDIDRLDQTVFTFVINKLFPTAKVMPVSEKLITNSEYFSWYLHNSNEKIEEKVGKPAAYINGKMCIPKF